ncbi:MAG: hypothetical protein RLZZ600_1114 [Actinomycetota bacterium]
MSSKIKAKVAAGYTLLATALLTLTTGAFLAISLSDLSIAATLDATHHLHDQPVESNGFNGEALGLLLRNSGIYLGLLVSAGVLAGVGGALLRSARNDVPYEPVRHRTTSTINPNSAATVALAPLPEPKPEPAPVQSLSADVIATIAYGEPSLAPLGAANDFSTRVSTLASQPSPTAPPLIPAPAAIPTPAAVPATVPAPTTVADSAVASGPLGAAPPSNSFPQNIDEPALDYPDAMRAGEHVARTEATGVQSPTTDKVERYSPSLAVKSRNKKYSKASLAWLVVGSITFVLGAIAVGSIYLTGVAHIGQEQTLIAILVLVVACLGLQVLALSSLTNVFINRFRDKPVTHGD